MPLGEFALIDRYFSRSPRRRDVLLGVGDDAALLQVPAGRALVAATDTLVAGRHFLTSAPPESIGHQALAVNLSDLAAMGAEPAWALLSLSMPEVQEAWLERFAAGLHALADRYAVDLVGGDTVRGPLVVTIELLGHVDPSRALRRSGARPGEFLYVSGWPGESAAGLAALESGVPVAAQDPLVARHLYAEPRVALGQALLGRAGAAMDVSDGLLGDLARLCAASGAGARVDLERLPVSAELTRRFDPHERERFILQGGDDYELLFTLPAQQAEAIADTLSPICPVTCIGVIESQAGVRCTRNGVPTNLTGAGYDHFA